MQTSALIKHAVNDRSFSNDVAVVLSIPPIIPHSAFLQTSISELPCKSFLIFVFVSMVYFSMDFDTFFQPHATPTLV